MTWTGFPRPGARPWSVSGSGFFTRSGSLAEGVFGAPDSGGALGATSGGRGNDCAVGAGAGREGSLAGALETGSTGTGGGAGSALGGSGSKVAARAASVSVESSVDGAGAGDSSA